jgi:hypothetical protein
MIVFLGWGGVGDAPAPVAALAVFFALLVDFFVTISLCPPFSEKEF